MRTRDVIGLIPCGGYATRISPLPCSKEILPVGLRRNPDGSIQPKVVSHYLLEKMQAAGVRRAFFVLRQGKWDIAQYFGNGANFEMDLGYLVMGRPDGPPYTLDQAYPFVRNADVAFGFPDILFGPRDAFQQALGRLRKTGAALVLGLYPAHKTWRWHRAETDRTGRVRALRHQASETTSKLGWVFAVWTSKFTEFMHEYLVEPGPRRALSDTGLAKELTVGEVIEAAIRAGLSAQSVFFPRPTYLDIGTPGDLQRVHGRDSKAMREIRGDEIRS